MTVRAPKFDPNAPPPLRRPALPKRTLVLVCLSLFSITFSQSIVLFTIGVIFLLIGLSVFWNTSLAESIPFTVLGSICFIPGAYHVFLFFKVWRGRDASYKYEMFENYD